MTHFEADARLQLLALPAWAHVITELEMLRDAVEQKLEKCPAEELALTVGQWRTYRTVIASLRAIPEDARKIIDAHTRAVGALT